MVCAHEWALKQKSAINKIEHNNWNIQKDWTNQKILSNYTNTYTYSYILNTRDIIEYNLPNT